MCNKKMSRIVEVKCSTVWTLHSFVLTKRMLNRCNKCKFHTYNFQRSYLGLQQYTIYSTMDLFEILCIAFDILLITVRLCHKIQ